MANLFSERVLNSGTVSYPGWYIIIFDQGNGPTRRGLRVGDRNKTRLHLYKTLRT